MLVEKPVAFLHLAGEDVIGVEAVHDTWAVLHEIHHLATKLSSLVEGQFVGILTLICK